MSALKCMGENRSYKHAQHLGTMLAIPVGSNRVLLNGVKAAQHCLSHCEFSGLILCNVTYILFGEGALHNFI